MRLARTYRRHIVRHVPPAAGRAKRRRAVFGKEQGEPAHSLPIAVVEFHGRRQPKALELGLRPDGEGQIGFLIVRARSHQLREGRQIVHLLERLSEMMFVDAIRRHVEELPPETTGWLAGLRDRYVGRALALLHERPAAPWTIEDLSSQVGLSRSALHERFVALIGQPPVQYLTNWRMQLASRLLLEGRSTVAKVAADVGYDSEAAFARAFKRLVGMPPAAWRRSHELGAQRVQ